MATIYLSPDDLNATQAAAILDYLNSPVDAEMIAARIELENELDIGVRLAERLIQAREQLGGQFENLQQVYDVPYIGPERFTEIAVSLLNLNLPDSYTDIPSYSALLDELTLLRTEINQLRTSMGGGLNSQIVNTRKIQLRVLQADVFLGQHVTVEIYAFDSSNQRPLVNQPVTLSTNWGVLQYQEGYSWQQDAVVEIRTDIQGRAKVRLRSPTYETLTQEQQLALEAALLNLDKTAVTPAAIREQLEDLVLSYRLENNLALRKAIDIYFNVQKVAILESVNRRFFSDGWQLQNALISAYLHENDAEPDLGEVRGSSNGYVESLSSVKVRLKSWVGAWYQTYLDYLENGNQFSERVNTLTSNNANGGLLINGVLSELSRWTQGELGIAGSIIGEKSTESTVRKFLADDIQTLPDQQQLQLYSALSVALKPTSVTQVGTLQAVADTQLTLADEITSRVGSVQDISTLADTVQQGLDTINAQLNDFQVNLSQFGNDYSDFNSSLTGFSNDLSGFNTDYSSFNGNLVTFNTDYSSFNSNLGTFNSDYSDFNSNLGTFNTDYSSFNNNILTFNSNFTEFNVKNNTLEQRFDTFDSQVNTVNTNLEAVQTDINDFNVSYAQYNKSLGTLQADIGELKLNVNRIDTRTVKPDR